MGILTNEDSKGWLENAFNTVMGMRNLPANIGIDAARNLAALIAGGKLREPSKYTATAYENIGQSAGATINPVTSALRRARQSALQSMDADPLESDTTPTAGGALPVIAQGQDFPAPALPAQPRKIAGPALTAPTPQNIESADLSPLEEPDAFPPYRAPATPAPSPAPAPAATPRQSYVEMFKEILAQKQAETKAPLTDEQQRALRLQFFLSMMSNSAKPGARILGAMGDAGQTMLTAQRSMEKENLTRAEKSRADQLETAYKMLGVRNLDEDNLRADRREAAETGYRKAQEKRFEAQDKRDQRRLDIEIDKLKQEGKKIVRTEKAADGTYVHFLADGTELLSNIKAKGREPSAVEIAYNMAVDPKRGGLSGKEAFERIFPGKGNVTFDDNDIAQMYRDALKQNTSSFDPVPMPSFEEFKARVRGTSTSPQKPATEAAAHAEAKAAIKKGKDRNAVNKRLQEWGYKPV